MFGQSLRIFYNTKGTVSKLRLGRGGLKDSRTSVNWISGRGTLRTISGPFLSLCFLPAVRRAASTTGCCPGDSLLLKDPPITDGGPGPALSCVSETWPQGGKEWLIQCSNVSSNEVLRQHPRGPEEEEADHWESSASSCSIWMYSQGAAQRYPGWRAGKSGSPARLPELCFLLISTRGYRIAGPCCLPPPTFK